MILTCILIATWQAKAFLKCDHKFEHPYQKGVVASQFLLPPDFVLGEEFRVEWDGKKVLKIWRQE